MRFCTEVNDFTKHVSEVGTAFAIRLLEAAILISCTRCASVVVVALYDRFVANCIWLTNVRAAIPVSTTSARETRHAASRVQDKRLYRGAVEVADVQSCIVIHKVG